MQMFIRYRIPCLAYLHVLAAQLIAQGSSCLPEESTPADWNLDCFQSNKEIALLQVSRKTALSKATVLERKYAIADALIAGRSGANSMDVANSSLAFPPLVLPALETLVLPVEEGVSLAFLMFFASGNSGTKVHLDRLQFVAVAVVVFLASFLGAVISMTCLPNNLRPAAYFEESALREPISKPRMSSHHEKQGVPEKSTARDKCADDDCSASTKSQVTVISSILSTESSMQDASEPLLTTNRLKVHDAMQLDLDPGNFKNDQHSQMLSSGEEMVTDQAESLQGSGRAGDLGN